MENMRPLIQIDDEIREMTDDELAAHEAAQATAAKAKAVLDARANAKAAIAERLGLTADELATLLS